MSKSNKLIEEVSLGRPAQNLIHIAQFVLARRAYESTTLPEHLSGEVLLRVCRLQIPTLYQLSFKKVLAGDEI